MGTGRLLALRVLIGSAVVIGGGCGGSGARSVPRAIVAPVSSPSRSLPTPVVPGFDCENGASLGATNVCGAAASHVDALATSIVCAPAPVPRATGARTAGRWDKQATPQYLDLVARRFGLSADDRKHLFADGVVVPPRLEYSTYVDALRDVHRSQLPLYVSIDAVLHAVYASNDKVIAQIESLDLQHEISSVLEAMHAKLTDQPGRYSRATERDLDLYLKVGRHLLEPTTDGTSLLDGDAEARGLVDLATRAPGLARVKLFDRERVVDFGAFRPRGHYAAAVASKNPNGADLSSYFRAATWLSRIEFNLVSRSSRSSAPSVDPSETPREAAAALALSDLAERAEVIDKIAKIEGVWAALAGRREDVSIADLRALVAKGSITNVASPDAPERLRAAIGAGFVRTARTHVQAEPSPALPVIATLLGPRITNDALATRPLAHPEVATRFEVPAVEMAFALGQDRALAHLDRDLTAFPGLRPALDRSRTLLFDPKTEPKNDLYSAWLGAVRGLSETPEGARPSFMETTAFADMRVASTVAAYAQIRHNYVLYVPTTYDEGGCEIPDGYVEPAPATYAALIDYAARGERALKALETPSATYFENLARMLRVLDRIATRELAGEPLRDDERRFLSMVAEEVRWEPNGYGATPRWDGWYYRMHRAETDALEDAKLVADYFVSVNGGTADYAGVKGVRMGFFVVDTGGGPRMAVGPVTRSFQAKGPLAPRWSDDDADAIKGSAPWAASYTSTAAPEPSFTLKTAHGEVDENITLEATTTSALGAVTIALLDHHRVPVVTVTKELNGSPRQPAKVRFEFKDYGIADKEIAKLGIQGIHIAHGDFHFVDVDVKQYELEAGEPKTWTFGPGVKHAPVRENDLHGKVAGRGRRF